MTKNMYISKKIASLVGDKACKGIWPVLELALNVLESLGIS